MIEVLIPVFAVATYSFVAYMTHWWTAHRGWGEGEYPPSEVVGLLWPVYWGLFLPVKFPIMLAEKLCGWLDRPKLPTMQVRKELK